MTTTDARRGAAAGEWLLLAVAIAWGLTFFSTKSLLERMPVMDFLTVRFGIATVLLIAIAPKALRMSRKTLLHGALIGVAFAVAQITQTFGLVYVSASVSGFVTGLYVVFTPLLGALLFKVRVRGLVWVAVGLATVGLAVLSMQLGSGAPFGLGEWLTLISAIFWGLHITLVGRYSQPDNVISLTIVQLGVASLIFTAGGLRDGLTLPNTGPDWAWMIYFATIVGAGTEFAQVWAQARVEASKAAVLMVTEPLWAAVFAVLFGGELVTGRLLAGGGLMIVAMLVAVRASPPAP
ncbi:MAG: DMT family transporter [Propionibacteriaceae bacterium]|nr:DMT family transporter [Propionibacteriaceae bacterium]